MPQVHSKRTLAQRQVVVPATQRRLSDPVSALCPSMAVLKGNDDGRWMKYNRLATAGPSPFDADGVDAMDRLTAASVVSVTRRRRSSCEAPAGCLGSRRCRGCAASASQEGMVRPENLPLPGHRLDHRFQRRSTVGVEGAGFRSPARPWQSAPNRRKFFFSQPSQRNQLVVRWLPSAFHRSISEPRESERRVHGQGRRLRQYRIIGQRHHPLSTRRLIPLRGHQARNPRAHRRQSLIRHALPEPMAPNTKHASAAMRRVLTRRHRTVHQQAERAAPRPRWQAVVDEDDGASRGSVLS